MGVIETMILNAYFTKRTLGRDLVQGTVHWRELANGNETSSFKEDRIY